MIKLILRYFVRYPFDFVFPPKNPRDLKRIYPKMETTNGNNGHENGNSITAS